MKNSLINLVINALILLTTFSCNKEFNASKKGISDKEEALAVISNESLYNSTLENTSSYKSAENCFTIDGFKAVASYLQNNGELLSHLDQMIYDSVAISLEVTINQKLMEIQYYTGHAQTILVLDTNENRKIPTYSVSIENNELDIHEYAGRIDSDENQREREVHWCHIVSALARK